MSRDQSSRRTGPIRLRLTGAGWLFLLISVLVGLAAIKSNASLLFVLFGAMMGAMVFSCVVARRSVGGVDLRRDIPSRVWQNQTVHLGYYLRNRRRRTPCLGLGVQEVTPVGIEGVAGYCLHLPPLTTFRAGARFTAQRRGAIELRQARVGTVFPFGLVSAYRHIEAPADMIVWPAKGKLTRQLLRRGAVETSSAAPSGDSGGQDEFFGLRDYRPGDAPRWIHWRKSATRNMPVVREMARPVPEVLWVIVDTYLADGSEPGPQVSERMLRLGATLVDYAFSRGYQVGVALGSGDEAVSLAPAAGLAPHHRALDALAQAKPNEHLRLGEVVAKIRFAQIRKAQVIVIAPQAASLDAAALAQLRRNCRHLAVVDEGRIESVFQDDPTALQQEARCP